MINKRNIFNINIDSDMPTNDTLILISLLLIH